MNVQVLPGDSPASIAQRLTGDPRRATELVLANPQKRRMAVPGGTTFETLRVGEVLATPWGWGVRSLAGLPHGVGKLGLTPSITDTGASLLTSASSALNSAAAALAQLNQGNGTAADVLSQFKTAVSGFQNAAQQASQAASSAQSAIVAASSQGQSDPAAVQAQNDYNNIQGNLTTIGSDYTNVSNISDPTQTDPTGAATDAQTAASNAVNSAQDAQNQATGWSGGNPAPPGNQTIPANVAADAQAVQTAINADSNYCTSVGQNGSAVNVAVHNFKVDWNAAGLTPQVPVGTGKFEPITAAAVSTALGGTGPAGCGGVNPPPLPPPNPNPNPNPPPTPTPTPAASTTSYTPWLIAGAVVLAAGIGYAVYRNRQHPTVARGLSATRRGAAHVGRAARAGARRVGSATRRGYHAVTRRVAPARRTRRLAR